jgi:tetratricopeptide (TPR) repeat protein
LHPESGKIAPDHIFADMIGRNEQLQQIYRHIESVASGNTTGNVLFVTGEAGIGKSTLLRSVAEGCGTLPQPPLVAMAECSTPLAGHDIGEIEALQPWAEVMAQLATRETGRKHDAKKLIGEFAMAWVRCVPVVGDVLESVVDTAKIIRRETGTTGASASEPQLAANQQQVFQQYINFLSTLSAQTPLVLMIDDFHWADTSSTNLLFTAARQLEGKPVIFIIAYRPDDAASSRDGQGHPILHVRNELERYSLAVEIGVPKMTPDDMDRLLRRRYPPYRNNDRFEEWLAHISGGNALFVTQFLMTLEEDGYIDRENGVVQEGFEHVHIPRSAQAVVQERIRRMSEEAKELLRYASVEGDTFTSMVLAKVTETPQLKLLQKLRIVEQSYQVVVSLGKQQVYARETTAYQFAHALIHKAMYESLEEEERELLHEAIFETLKEEWETARDEGIDLTVIAARLATHAIVLREHLFAAEILLEGACDSWKEYAEEETLRQIEGALENIRQSREIPPPKKGEPTDRTTAIEGEALLLRGKVHQLHARNEDALRDYAAALELFETAGSIDRKVEVMNRMSKVHVVKGEYAEAGSIAGQALALAGKQGDWKGEAESLLRLAEICKFRSESVPALEYAERALALYTTHGYEPGRGAALQMVGSAHMTSSGPVKSLEYLTQSRDLFNAIGDRFMEAQALSNCGLAYTQTGDLAAALECYRRSLEIQTALGDRPGEAKSLTSIAVTYYYLGDLRSARDYFEQGAELNEICGNPLQTSFSLRGLGVTCRELGEVDRALEYFRRCLALDREIGNRVGEGNTLLCIGTTYNGIGDLPQALENLQRSLELEESAGNHESIAQASSALGALYVDMNELPLALEHFHRALEIFRKTGDRSGQAYTLAGVGQAYRVLGELDRSRDALDEALAIARDSGFDIYTAVSLGELALLEEAEAVSLDGEDRLRRLHEAVGLLEECTAIYRKIGNVDLAKWEGELEQLKKILSRAS